jgi:phospholipid N-methyltransferase
MDALTQEMRTVADRVMWFEPAEEALGYPQRFLAYLMTYGTLEEVLIARKYFSDQEFDRALRNAPPGIFDASSWNYWNLVYKHEPVPPLPRRVIPSD